MTTFDPNEKKKLDKFWDNLGYEGKTKKISTNDRNEKKLDEFWDKLGYGDKNKKISADENRIIP